MSIIYINTGTSANAGNGDVLRTAFWKVNLNFTELNNMIVSGAYGSIVQSSTPPVTTSTSTLWYDTVGGRTYVYYDNTWVDSSPTADPVNLQSVSTNIVPAVNNTYTLGSPTSQWKEIFVSTGSIYIGNVKLSNLDGQLQVQTVSYDYNTVTNQITTETVISSYAAPTTVPVFTVTTSLSVTQIVFADDTVQTTAGGGSNPFNQSLNTTDTVTFASIGTAIGNISQINGTNPGSELIIQTGGVHNFNFLNNGNLTIPNDIIGSGDQALVVQNTASGVAYLELPVDPSIDSVILANQAASSATVTIRVGDFGSEKDWTFNEFGALATPGIIYNTDTSNVGQLLLAGAPGEPATYLALPSDVGSTSMNVRLVNSNGNIQLTAGNNTWLYNDSGELTLPNGSMLFESSLIAASGTNAVLSQFDSNTQVYTMDYAVGVQTHNSGTYHTWLFNNTGDVELPGGSVLATSGYDVALVAGNDGTSTFGTVTISTQYPPDLTDRNWEFNSLGEFYLPLGGAIQETVVTNELWGTTTTSLTLVPAGAANGTQRLEIYGTIGGEGDHIHITSGDQTQTDLYLGNDTQYFAVGAMGQVEVRARPGLDSPTTGTSAYAGSPVWIYAGDAGDNGGNTIDGAPGGDVLISAGVASTGVGGDVLLYSGNGPTGYGSIKLSTNGYGNYLEFNKDGKLTLPSGGTLGPEGMGASGLSNGTSGNPVYIVNKKTNGDYLANIILTAGDGISGEISFEIWNTVTAVSKVLTINTACNLVFPDASVQNTAWVGGGSSVVQTNLIFSNDIDTRTFNNTGSVAINFTAYTGGPSFNTEWAYQSPLNDSVGITVLAATVASTATSTSTTTGALTVAGGVGIAGDLWAGNIYSNGVQLTAGGGGSGVTADSTTTFTNKTLNITLGGNDFQIQGNSIYSYSGSGPTLALTQVPTFQGFNFNDSGISGDGGTGVYYWTAGSADGTGTINKAGVLRTAGTSSNALFTFGANGAGTMSVQLDGSLFVGATLPTNSGGLNTDYPGWLVVQSGAKFGGDIDTLGRVLLNGSQFEDDSGVIDFLNVAGGAGNHIITCTSDWTLKVKARANGANQGNLWLEAGQNTKIKIHGNGSNIELIASTGTNAKTWTFASNGGITFPDATTQTTAFTGTSALIDITNTNGLTTTYYPTFVESRSNDQILRADVDLTYRTDTNTLGAGNITVTSLLNLGKAHETFTTATTASSVVNYDCANNQIFYHTNTGTVANWTANFTNLNLAAGKATAISLVIKQGNTGYYPSAVQIEGAAQTLNWQGNTNPTVNANRTDVVSFTILNDSGTYTVLGQLTGF